MPSALDTSNTLTFAASRADLSGAATPQPGTTSLLPQPGSTPFREVLDRAGEKDRPKPQEPTEASARSTARKPARASKAHQGEEDSVTDESSETPATKARREKKPVQASPSDEEEAPDSPAEVAPDTSPDSVSKKADVTVPAVADNVIAAAAQVALPAATPPASSLPVAQKSEETPVVTSVGKAVVEPQVTATADQPKASPDTPAEARKPQSPTAVETPAAPVAAKPQAIPDAAPANNEATPAAEETVSAATPGVTPPASEEAASTVAETTLAKTTTSSPTQRSKITATSTREKLQDTAPAPTEAAVARVTGVASDGPGGGGEDSEQFADLLDADGSTREKPVSRVADDDNEAPALFDAALSKTADNPRGVARADAPVSPEPPPETRFADANHASVVTSIQAQLLPNGGSMQIRLDPPELGDLQITVHMRDGVMTAAFQTSSADATRLLSHSLGDLKTVLEASGVNVEKLHVQQGPKEQSTSDSHGRPGNPSPDERQNARRDQERKDMIQKMWDKLAKSRDEVDVMA